MSGSAKAGERTLGSRDAYCAIFAFLGPLLQEAPEAYGRKCSRDGLLEPPAGMMCGIAGVREWPDGCGVAAGQLHPLLPLHRASLTIAKGET